MNVHRVELYVAPSRTVKTGRYCPVGSTDQNAHRKYARIRLGSLGQVGLLLRFQPPGV